MNRLLQGLILVLLISAPLDAQDRGTGGPDRIAVVEKGSSRLFAAARASVVGVSSYPASTNWFMLRGFRRGYGTGIYIGGDLLLSSHETLREGVSTQLVFLPGGRTTTARLVALDRRSGLCLLRLASRGHGLKPIVVADSRQAKVGDLVATVGNAYGSLMLTGDPSYSLGVVSGIYAVRHQGLYRGEVIETDAAVNFGAFGGPLVDVKGRMIGVISSSLSRGRWLGSCVPSAVASRFIDKRRRGTLDAPERGDEPGRAFLGVEVTLHRNRFLVVRNVLSGSPAAQAGLKAGDVLVSIDDRPIRSIDDLMRTLGKMRAGQEIVLGLYRRAVGRSQRIRVKLGTRFQ